MKRALEDYYFPPTFHTPGSSCVDDGLRFSVSGGLSGCEAGDKEKQSAARLQSRLLLQDTIDSMQHRARPRFIGQASTVQHCTDSARLRIPSVVQATNK